MVDEKRGTQVGVDRGRQEVGQSVAGEVVEDASAGHVWSSGVQADDCRDVFEVSDVELRAKTSRGITKALGTRSGYSPSVM